MRLTQWLGILLAVLLWRDQVAHAQSLNIPSRQGANVRIFYVDFEAEPYSPVTPENIATRPARGAKLNSRQFATIRSIVNHRYLKGRFRWFQTRLSVRGANRTLLVVDESGGFIDTYAGTTGQLTPEVFEKLRDFLRPFSPMRPTLGSNRDRFRRRARFANNVKLQVGGLFLASTARCTALAARIWPRKFE
jgi:hypothetical protein